MRARLVVVTASLSALALLGANTAGVIMLSSYLVDRVDQQLTLPGTFAVQQQRLVMALLSGEPAQQSEEVPGSQFLSEVFDADSRLYIYDQKGQRAVYPQERAGHGPVLPTAPDLAKTADQPFSVADQGGGSDWRVRVKIVEPADGLEEGGYIVTATSLAQVEATTNQLLLIDAVVMAISLGLLSVAAAILVRLGMRPLTRMEATADTIGDGDFGRRVADTDSHTEQGRLGRAMNAMLDRVEAEIVARDASEVKLRRFLADASHELRTPLTSIRGFAELYRRGGEGADAMRRIEAEAARMGVLVEDLLLLARLDEQRTPQTHRVDLLALVLDVVSDLHARSPHRTVRVENLDEASGLLEPVQVAADPIGLRQVLGNLLTNADRHTSPGEEITVRIGVRRPGALSRAVSGAGLSPDPDEPAAVLEVEDSGGGVPAVHARHVFERLYRADPARTGGGAGLGLSIAAALIEAHGGRIELVEQRTGTGATFRVVLPLPARKSQDS